LDISDVYVFRGTAATVFIMNVNPLSGARCATPLINTIFNPDDSHRSSEYDTTHPSKDRALYGPTIGGFTTKVVAATGSNDPAAYARRAVDEIFPDVLHYRIGTPAEFGFTVRNGRPHPLRTRGDLTSPTSLRRCDTGRPRGLEVRTPRKQASVTNANVRDIHPDLRMIFVVET
jgi:hypothetical protein